MDREAEYMAMIECATSRAIGMGLSVEATGQYVQCYIDGWNDHIRLLNMSAKAVDAIADRARASVRSLGLTVPVDG